MKKFTILLVLFISLLIAQTPDIDLSFRYEKANRELVQLQKIAKSKEEVTDNQECYDIKYYCIDLIVGTRYSKIFGNTQVVADVISAPLTIMELNFWDGLEIASIYLSIDEKLLTYSWENDILTIDLDSAYSVGDQIAVNIVYNGYPGDNPYGYFTFETYNNQDLVWTLNEPYGARGWFPCKDAPSDKADSVDIKVKVPTGYLVASNGNLVSQTEVINSTVFHWHEQYPIVTYLISLAIYPYSQFSDWYIYDDNDSMEVQYYVFPENYSDRQSDYSKTVDMIAYFSEIFGQYPFIEEKYGHVEFGWGGGMEHQTITSLGGSSEMLIAHELAHQWWGDAITCHSFQDLWLNEGFASYSEALWYEHEYSGTASDYQLASQYFGDGTIYIEDLDGSESYFSGSLRYDKASWVLHMLRNVVGDATFFEILQTYYLSNDFKYKTATTEQFIEHCNSISGLNLDKFFQQWIFEAYYPDYTYYWSSNETDSGYVVNLTINQDQTNTGYFWMPIDIRITTLNEDYDYVIWDSLETQSFELFVTKEPLAMEFDPDNWILKTVKQTDSSIAEESLPEEYHLYQNYPNPFNPETTITFMLSEQGEISLKVFNILGELVEELASGPFESGYHRIKFDSTDLPSGLYLYNLTYNNNTICKKMMLLK